MLMRLTLPGSFLVHFQPFPELEQYLIDRLWSKHGDQLAAIEEPFPFGAEHAVRAIRDGRV